MHVGSSICPPSSACFGSFGAIFRVEKELAYMHLAACEVPHMPLCRAAALGAAQLAAMPRGAPIPASAFAAGDPPPARVLETGAPATRSGPAQTSFRSNR